MVHSLHIPTPCHEDWDAMTPQAQGRHCTACRKTVVDFTAMSKAEILAYFKARPASVRTCGRLRANQLAATPLPYRPVRKLRAWAALAAVISLPLIGFAMPPTTLPPVVKSGRQQLLTDTARLRANKAGFIHGRLVNAEGEPLIGATVAITGTGTGTVTNIEGFFKLQVPSYAKSVAFSYLGYIEQTVAVVPYSAQEVQSRAATTITLAHQNTLIHFMGVMALPKRKKRRKKSSE